MDRVRTYQFGSDRVTLRLSDSVAPPTPYTLLLAEYLPDQTGKTVVDIGTGSGILAILAALRGARRVWITETNPQAIELALRNAERNGVGGVLTHLASGSAITPTPQGEVIDTIICNPSQLPLPEPDTAQSLYYSGPDGRAMIDAVIAEASRALKPTGQLLITLNSMTDFPRSLRLLLESGLRATVLAERELAFRSFINRAWLDELGGAAGGRYLVRDGQPYETFYVVEARRL